MGDIKLYRKLKNLLKRIIYNSRRPTLQEYIEKGLKVGKNFSMQEGCSLDIAHCYSIEIGDNVTLAPEVLILAHDASTKNKLGYTKIGAVRIGDNVFIGAKSIILPNVKIGNNVIIGAVSVVTKSIPDNTVVVGNPAEIILSFNDYLEKNKIKMQNTKIFDEDYTFRSKKLTLIKKKEVKQALENYGICYIK